MAKKRRARKKENEVKEVHVLNGPNMNMLGFREPELYGTDTLEDLEHKITEAAKETKSNVKLYFFQTNYEGEMLEYIQKLVLGPARQGSLAGVILNPAAWTHTSLALRDAVAMLRPVPMVEVHMTNPVEREEFRHFSYIEDLVDYRVIGMGAESYVEALRWLVVESKKDRLDVH